MADGPTVAQILTTRDASLASCEATGKAERATREATYPPVKDIIKGLATFGPGGQLKMDLLVSQLKEQSCKVSANVTADTALGVREAELQAKVMVLNGALEGERLANAPFHAPKPKAKVEPTESQLNPEIAAQAAVQEQIKKIKQAK